jgi:hypothetical protein
MPENFSYQLSSCVKGELSEGQESMIAERESLVPNSGSRKGLILEEPIETRCQALSSIARKTGSRGIQSPVSRDYVGH